MSTIVPPGGFAGFAQMTPASQRSLGRGGGVGARKRRKGSSARGKYTGRVNRGPTKRRGKRTAKRGNRLVKGSAAAKRFMAALRKKRRR